MTAPEPTPTPVPPAPPIWINDPVIILPVCPTPLPESGPCAPEATIAIHCPPLTVPGWLDENGQPTSCVSDHPCPGFDAETCAIDDNEAEEFPPPLPLDPLPDSGEPVTIQPDPAPDLLAETGPLETGLALVLAVAAIAVGARLALGRRA